MNTDWRKRAAIIELLKSALALASETGDHVTGYLIEITIDEAKSKLVDATLSRDGPSNVTT